MEGTAQEIYQGHLDLVSQAVWDRDYDRVAAVMRYPHVIHLAESDHLIDTEAELKLDVETFRDSLMGLGATAYHRVCRDASFDPSDDDRITGRHLTYVMRGGSYLVEPYNCAMILTRVDGVWLGSGIRLAMKLTSGLNYLHPDRYRGTNRQPPRHDA
ncbi:MAG: hypothetical protein AAF919_04285 [Pseudomonadota bacterium]